MCFYLYSPAAPIEVSFASETITLNKDLSTRISIDLLLKNIGSGSEPVKSLRIIYPRASQQGSDAIRFCRRYPVSP